MQKIKYITNRELLAEIQKSKQTFCHFSAPEYASYDAVVTSTEILSPEFLAATLHTKMARLTKAGMSTSVTEADVVFRVMGDGHLPEETNEKRRKKSSSGGWVPRTNFPPFQHFVLHGDLLVEVGRSHWKGDLESGEFCLVHGKINNRLASMFIMLVEQYSKRGNWRGYCVDSATEALTQRGWLGIDEITEQDIILSYDDGKLKWSKIKSIYRDEFSGKMFHLTARGLDALVTEGHKFVTQDGLKPVELLREADQVILTGDPVDCGTDPALHVLTKAGCQRLHVAAIDFHGGKRHGRPNEPTIDYTGQVWCPETEYGSFMARRNGTMFLTGNSYVAEMRGQALVQLSQVGLQFDESRSDNPFAWYTQIVKNVFRRILLLEKRNQDIRDDLLIMAGALPSFTRQVEDELGQKAMMSDVHVVGAALGSDSEGNPIKKEAKKRGRKPKVRE